MRIANEWGIGRVKTLWSMLTNKSRLQALKSPVAMYWTVAVFFSNIHCIVNGGCQVSDYFSCPPPSLQEYLED